MNLKHLCVAAPFGFVVSSNWTELKIARAYARIGSLEEVLQTCPSWWTVTAKSIAVVGIALGMKFVHSFGLIWGNLKPSNILFDESHQIQIVDIIPNRTESHCQENFDANVRRANSALSAFAAPEVLSGHRLTQKADVFVFPLILFTIIVSLPPIGEAADLSGRAERLFIVSDSIEGFLPSFISQLIHSGLSIYPND
jgi:serine/threonine protein kinase